MENHERCTRHAIDDRRVQEESDKVCHHHMQKARVGNPEGAMSQLLFQCFKRFDLWAAENFCSAFLIPLLAYPFIAVDTNKLLLCTKFCLMLLCINIYTIKILS